jgi:hypothetical protein
MSERKKISCIRIFRWSLLALQKVSSLLLFNTYLVMWKYNCEPLWPRQSIQFNKFFYWRPLLSSTIIRYDIVTLINGVVFVLPIKLMQISMFLADWLVYSGITLVFKFQAVWTTSYHTQLRFIRTKKINLNLLH